MVDFNRDKVPVVPHDTTGAHDPETCPGCMITLLMGLLDELCDTKADLQHVWENVGAEKNRAELTAALFANVQRALRLMCLANVAFTAIRQSPDSLDEVLWKLERTTAYMAMLGGLQMYLKFIRICYAAIGEKPHAAFTDFEHLGERVTAMSVKLVEMAKRRKTLKNTELMELVKRFYQIPNEPITT